MVLQIWEFTGRPREATWSHPAVIKGCTFWCSIFHLHGILHVLCMSVACQVWALTPVLSFHIPTNIGPYFHLKYYHQELIKKIKMSLYHFELIHWFISLTMRSYLSNSPFDRMFFCTTYIWSVMKWISSHINSCLFQLIGTAVLNPI